MAQPPIAAAPRTAVRMARGVRPPTAPAPRAAVTLPRPRPGPATRVRRRRQRPPDPRPRTCRNAAIASGVGWSKTSVDGSVSPVTCARRLRSTTDPSESKPSSLNERSGSMSSEEAWPRAVAACERTTSSTSSSRCSADASASLRASDPPTAALAPARRAGVRDELGEQRRQLARPGASAQRGEVERHGDEPRLGVAQRRVEQGEALRGRQRALAGALLEQLDVAAAEPAGHPARVLPQPPGHRRRGQPRRAAALRERVERGVGCARSCPGPDGRTSRPPTRTARTPRGPARASARRAVGRPRTSAA